MSSDRPDIQEIREENDEQQDEEQFEKSEEFENQGFEYGAPLNDDPEHKYSEGHPEAEAEAEAEARIDYLTPVQKATTQIKPVLLDIAGNVIGIGESLRILGGNAIVFSPEDAQQFLQNIRTSDIDSTDWVAHKGGIDYLNKRIEFAELLLAGRADEARDMMASMQEAYSIYLNSKAENTGVDFLALWLEKQGILTAYTILLMYVTESVKRGVWKPVAMSPLRVSAPSSA